MSKEAILIIEDQKSMASFLYEKLDARTDLPVLVAHTMQEAVEIIESDVRIIVCLTDLNLPDAEEGATVPLLKKHKITTVVLTVNYTEKARKQMYEQRVADYVIKDGPAALEYAASTVVSLIENSSINVWMLAKPNDNSRYLKNLLNTQRYNTFVFDSIEELSKAIKAKSPDLLLINELDDYDSIEMLKLIQLVRYYYPSCQLPVMIADHAKNTNFAIKLMKYGVSDFFNLEFSAEEFQVRVRLNMAHAQNYKKLEEISQTDALTGLYNSRYFLEESEQYYDTVKLENRFAVMVDIDFFKKVNDTYGHMKGDDAIRYTGQELKRFFKGHLVSRFGGEEFCIVGCCEQQRDIVELAEKFRKHMEDTTEEKTGVPFTVSVGLSFNAEDVSKALVRADRKLYKAKESGRNQICC